MTLSQRYSGMDTDGKKDAKIDHSKNPAVTKASLVVAEK